MSLRFLLEKKLKAIIFLQKKKTKTKKKPDLLCTNGKKRMLSFNADQN